MQQLPTFTPALLRWFAGAKRGLPFRIDPTPYHIWISEIMGQQTRMAAVVPYYNRFIKALPTIAHLAACDEQALLKLWEGLGYYSRARNLQKAAQVVMQDYGGELPRDFAALKALPGIGPYTAGAIASIAFNLPEVAVDGNVLRVFSRLLLEEGDVSLPATKKKLAAAVAAHQPPDAPGTYNEALMELGALICLPTSPRCGDCPVTGICRARQAGREDSLPIKAAKKASPTEKWSVLIIRHQADVLLCRRPETGLLAGLWQPVMLPGFYTRQALCAALQAFLPGEYTAIQPLPSAKHVFTHKVWQMEGWLCHLQSPTAAPEGFLFADAATVQKQYPLPAAFSAFYSCIISAGPQSARSTAKDICS